MRTHPILTGDNHIPKLTHSSNEQTNGNPILGKVELSSDVSERWQGFTLNSYRMTHTIIGLTKLSILHQIGSSICRQSTGLDKGCTEARGKG